MRTWMLILLGFLAGVLLTAILFTITAQPRGQSVQLLPAPTTSPITVDISGAVALPGLYTIPPGSRLVSAVDAAGGLLSTADQSRINLAAFLQDGQKIFIPAIGEPIFLESTDPAFPGKEKSLAIDTPINLNTASEEELMSLPGIGETRAKQIIAYRDIHGPFSTVEEIQNIPGIGPDTYNKLRDLIVIQ